MAKERIIARARTQYTDYMVKEPMELMEFLAAKMPDASRTKLKALLSKRVVYVDSVITTQYNFPLKPGMKVQISREKGRKEFNNKLLKIVYEDAYLIVVEKMQGLLSVNTERQKERTAYTILNEYVQRSGRQHRVYIVHRLDRDTSGLLMFAKDEKTQNTLRDNWHNIVTDRRYVAVVAGEMENNAGMVRSWLTDRKLYVYSSPTDDGGKEAITHHQTRQRLLARGTDAGDGTQKPNPRAHAGPGTSHHWRRTLRTGRDKSYRTTGAARLQAVLPPSCHRRADAV